MTHYSSKEWQLYRHGKYCDKQRLQMQKHLAKCDSCLEKYISFIGQEEEDAADHLIPPTFETDLAQKIEQNSAIFKKNSRRRYLINYSTAAALTLLLLGGGTFEATARELPRFFEERLVTEINHFNPVDFSNGGVKNIVYNFLDKIDELLIIEEDK
jgi:hypothetical protein